jgi:hypothetical protein
MSYCVYTYCVCLDHKLEVDKRFFGRRYESRCTKVVAWGGGAQCQMALLNGYNLG